MLTKTTLLAVAGLLSTASAQLRQRDAAIRWYWNAGCSGEPHTTVVAVQGFCQLVPNAVNFVGYRVSCNPDGSGSGNIQYCSDANCGSCSIVQQFSRNQCVANDRALWNNAGFTVECPVAGSGDIIVPESQFLSSSAAEINWFEFPGCGASPANFDRTIVVAGQNLCHLVPNAPGNEGYKVACNADGSGTISFCSDRTCGSCSINSPFSSEVCLPNPPRYGSASVAIRCPGVAPGPLVPFVARNLLSAEAQEEDHGLLRA